MERAKELFLGYSGNRFYMDLNGEGSEYAGYHVPKETEEMWAKEHISCFLESGMQGKEALRAYSAAIGLLDHEKSEDIRSRCLYYPLRAKHLDDVTILFMLPVSFRMAEKEAKERRISREDIDAYLRELSGYRKLVLARAEDGTLSRAKDYVMQEFSDPVYVADYLNSLEKEWAGLL